MNKTRRNEFMKTGERPSLKKEKKAAPLTIKCFEIDRLKTLKSSNKDDYIWQTEPFTGVKEILIDDTPIKNVINSGTNVNLLRYQEE